MILGLGLIAFFGGMAEKQEAEALEEQGCALKSKEPTGRRVYCGKACTRDEIRTVYACNVGEMVVVH